jgi:hypothetical protein
LRSAILGALVLSAGEVPDAAEPVWEVGPQARLGKTSAGIARGVRALGSVDVAGVLFDAAERAPLCDLLDELGPQAPTLLDRWTTRDLAAHLVLREHDLLPAPGLVVPGAWAASPNGDGSP